MNTPGSSPRNKQGTTLRQAWARVVAFFRKRELDRDLDEELAAHLELATEDYLRHGLSPSEARRRALIKLGGVEPSKELHRASRGLPWLDGMVKDVRYALRGLRAHPGFALTAVATLAIGIGINTAVFTVTNALLFKGFPLVAGNDRLVYMTSYEGCCVSYPDFEDWRAQSTSFEGMAITHGVQVRLEDANGFPERYDATEVSAETFQLVGQRPILGRDFLPSDEAPGAAPVAILEYRFWERRFARDPAIVGRAVRINGAPTTIIGVMPEGFSFPQRLELWVPLVKTPDIQRRDNRQTWMVVGRLAGGVTIEQARAEMETIGKRLARDYPDTNQGMIPLVSNFPEFFLGPNSTMLYGALWGAVSFVLLIACANLANLLLARSMERSREISLRIALGAGRWRVIRQLLTESLLIAVAGGFLGWWIARWGVLTYAAMARQSSWMSWMIADYSLDSGILAYLIAISIGTGLLFGLAPASRLWKLDVNAALKDAGRGSVSGPMRGAHGKVLSRALLAAEMALAVVLLGGAGVMIRSFLKVYTVDLGVDTASLLTPNLEWPEGKFAGDEDEAAFYDRLKLRLEAIPGVESIAIASTLPGWDTRKRSFQLPGDVPDAGQRLPLVGRVIVGPGYFRTLGPAMLAGREFSDADTASALPVVIVNQQFASQHWPGENPLGKSLRLSAGPAGQQVPPGGDAPQDWRTVVGVAPDIAQDVLQAGVKPLVYVPYRQNPLRGMTVVARTRVRPEALVPVFRSAIQEVDSGVTIWSIGAIEDSFERIYWRSQFYGILFASFAAIALLLASVGLYAVIAHSVSRRTQEMGIRMAMGAGAVDILKLVLREGLLPLGVGLAFGLAVSLGVNRLLELQLVQVSPSDPLTYLAAAGVLILSAMLGCWIPARRAMRVDPAVALRHE